MSFDSDTHNFSDNLFTLFLRDHKRYMSMVDSLVLAALMSLVISGVVTLVNTGLHNGIVEQWIAAYVIAFPTAVVSLWLVRPLATLITRKIIGGRSASKP